MPLDVCLRRRRRRQRVTAASANAPYARAVTVRLRGGPARYHRPFFTPGELAALTPPTAASRHRNFRWLWSGTLFSTAAQWIQQATFGWVVYDLTASAA